MRVQAELPKAQTQLFGGSSPESPPAGPEDVAVPGRVVGARSERLLEPRVLVGGVVRDHVDHDLQPQGMGPLDQLVGLIERAQLRVDVAVVGDVVAAVDHRRGEPRGDPDGVRAEAGDMVEALDRAPEIADTVAVAVCERPRIHLVQHTAAPPPWSIGHVYPFTAPATIALTK